MFLRHLDNHSLWEPKLFAVHCFKIIMYSVQVTMLSSFCRIILLCTVTNGTISPSQADRQPLLHSIVYVLTLQASHLYHQCAARHWSSYSVHQYSLLNCEKFIALVEPGGNRLRKEGRLFTGHIVCVVCFVYQCVES